MSAKSISLIVVILTSVQLYVCGFEIGLLLFIPARIWFLLKFMGIKSHFKANVILEACGWILQVVYIVFVKFDVNWIHHILMLANTLIVSALIWYDSVFFVSIDVKEEEVEKYIK